jgi:hypothetical protein
MLTKTKAFRIVALAALVGSGACNDLLKVESPGRISDADLQTKDAISGMVTGMKYDLSQAVDNNLEILALASEELFHGGSYDWADIPRGVINDDDPGVGGSWNSTQQARWVSEHGVPKIQDLLSDAEFAKSSDAARAYIYGGYANRILGGNWCSSVIDGGPEIPNTDHFQRAVDQFTSAIPIAQAAGQTDLVSAAYAGRAQAKVLMGDWTGAAADAAQVPSEFVFYAEIDVELRNILTYETHNRYEYTVYNTYMADHPDDPRAPWVIARNNDGTVANGANGSTPHYQQQKYEDNGSDVALSKGTEMLLVRAEAALHSNDIAGAYTFMNQARDVYGMDHLTQAADLNAAWADLRFERGATLWLEGRRLEDLRRWYAETGPAHDDTLNGRATCIPISEAEKLANHNFRG